ncbi:MAG TPA: hypothetical protein VKG78_05470, partial [Opitutaceae bacterium]|nr:hypothetical protein [Opitutaceae bacterium]
MNELLKSFGMFLRYNWFRIAICMPAVLCGTGAVVFAVWGVLKEQITARYSGEADRQFQAKNYASACICFERLVQLQPEQSEVLYGLGMTLDALGKSGRAAAILSSLAPSDRQGY